MNYTDYETICRVWDVEEIKDLMSRRFYYNASELRREELNDLWVQSPEYRETASFGSNWGYYVGMDRIADYYVVQHTENRQKQLDAICAANPSIKNERANLGIGCLVNQPVSTALVCLSDDGKTARGLWYSIGHDTSANADGAASAIWIHQKIAVDFVREKSGWKIWHLVLAMDIQLEAGEDFAEQPIRFAPGENPVEVEFGVPDIPMITHDPTFNWWDDYPPPPEPYACFDIRESYAPEGHPNYRKGGMAR